MKKMVAGLCVRHRDRCDGRDGVGLGGIDEMNCENYTCPVGYTKCLDNRQCIKREFLCDGIATCADQSDETGLTLSNKN